MTRIEALRPIPDRPARATAFLVWWRAVNADLAAAGAPEARYGEARALYRCGYAAPQAARVLA